MKVHARVRVTIDVPINQPWAGDALAADVFKEAQREAREIIAARFGGEAKIVDMIAVATIVEDK